MSDDDKTPTEKQNTLELILASVNRTEEQARETKLYAERSHDISMQMFEQHKSLRSEVKELRQRTWLPSLIAVAAALVSLACAFAAAAR